LGITQTANGELKMLTAEGESVAGPTLQIGNTNSRIRFGCGMKEFVNRWCMEGPTHHCALGIGRVGPVLRKVAQLLKLPHVEVACAAQNNQSAQPAVTQHRPFA
jgi:L-arabinose isomerase